VVMQALGERALTVRPGLIVGPGDRTGRFSHWPWRIAEGGAVLVPDVPADTALQFIDVRDLAGWMVHLLERDTAGVFNANGPVSQTSTEPGTWPGLLAACRDEAWRRGAPAAELVPVRETYLVEQGVAPWTELPLWLPPGDASLAGFMRIGVSRAQAHGLRTRPLRETIAAVLDEHHPPLGDARRGKALTREREARLIADWRASTVSRGHEPGRPNAATPNP
jgi:2'-hydroxyisoflavone reductase